MWKDISTVCERHYRELQRFLLRRVHSPDIAADLTQETYLRLLRARDTEKIVDIRGFLFTIASNLARDHLRQRSRLDRIDGGPLHASFASAEASVEGKVAVHEQVGRLQQAIDDNGRTYEARGKVVVLAASTLESARLLLLSKSSLYPNGLANASGHVGHNFCEHVMGPGVLGLVKEQVGKARTLDDGRPGGFYIPRFRNLTQRHSQFIRGYGFEGGSGSAMFPDLAIGSPGFGVAYKKHVRDHAGAFIDMGGFGEVLARYENYVDLDPVVRDRWGIPVLRFHYRFGDNEKKMAADMVETAREMFEAAGIEVIEVGDEVLTEGWSIHEMGTARMGHDPKTSVLNPFQQAHEVKNLFVVDGSSHVSAACQNPTWTILALCWRSCDYLAGEFKRGHL